MFSKIKESLVNNYYTGNIDRLKILLDEALDEYNLISIARELTDRY